MRKLIFCLFCLFVYGEDLKQSYSFSQDKIHSQLLFPKAPYFLIANFGEHFELRIPAKKLYALFREKGYPLKEGEQGEILFSYKLPYDASKIEKEIKAMFERFYAPYHLKVEKVYLKPLAEMSGERVKILSAALDEKMLKKNRFIFTSELQINEHKKYSPFLCEVKASLEAYVSLAEIRAGEDLSSENVEKRILPFQVFGSLPATGIENYSARSFIAKDQVILLSKLKPKLIVKKGDWVDVLYREDSIVIEGRFEALQNGSLNQEIMLKNPQSKKQIKAKIIGAKKAILQ